MLLGVIVCTYLLAMQHIASEMSRVRIMKETTTMIEIPGKWKIKKMDPGLG